MTLLLVSIPILAKPHLPQACGPAGRPEQWLGVMTMERLLAKNRVAVILTAALVVGMYIFWFMGKARAESMLTSAWGFAVPLHSRRPRRRRRRAFWCGQYRHRGSDAHLGFFFFAAFFGAALTGSLLLGVLFGLGAGMVLGGFLAWTPRWKWQTDQIIAGVVINIVATGITSFYYKQGQTLPGVFLAGRSRC